MPPIVLLNAVGLTPRLLPLAPRLSRIAESGWAIPLREITPAVTCSAQVTMLTGEPPSRHGIVANGWLFRDTNEIRFWQQSNRLIQSEPLYETAARRATARGRSFQCAKLFWWYNQGARVAISVTPKPWYALNGNKAFGIAGTPKEIPQALEAKLGSFPFPAFWGPTAGLPATQWIARAAAAVLDSEHPDLTLVYLPHLDYDPQRFGPSGCDMTRQVRQLDDACQPILDVAARMGAQVWIVSEYGHCDVTRPVYLNRILRTAGLLEVRHGPFGEQLDLYGSRAFAVCDHQLAHVYVRDPVDVPRVRDILGLVEGVSRVLVGPERAEIELDHERSGELVVLSSPDGWFAYPFWLDEQNAPDYARAVAIHHKPGYDPCELFFDPRLRLPKLHAARRVLQKKLGFRMTMDVVPLDASLVRGSHGLPAADPQDGALFVGHGPTPSGSMPMAGVRNQILAALDLAD